MTLPTSNLSEVFKIVYPAYT
uniref:Uncharacterized protein n=1 Tax=Arundo donax TaxID=35708 RepID=A0A0A8Z350_ARUDO